MIYSNFLYFIMAIILFSTAPLTRGYLFSFSGNSIWMVLMIFFFWQFNQYLFKRLRHQLDAKMIDLDQAKREYFRLINLNTVIAIVLFALELFIFNIKFMLSRIPFLGGSETFLNALGLVFFLLHLSIIWYWSFRFLGDVLSASKSPQDYIWGNIKFNLVIVIPWMLMSLIIDVLFLVKIPFAQGLMNSAVAQVIFIGLLLVLIAMVAPVLITRLWDCRPLSDSDLKRNILKFCQSQGIRFRKVMSWNALNRGLITAGVVGLIRPFRYLLITPGLINLLTQDEMMAVVSHEAGHVKQKHLFYYFVFFIGFMVFIFGILDRLLNLFLNTGFGFSLVLSNRGEFNLSILSFLRIALSLCIFVIYFRYIFGYFMRNFEREADLFCFQSGINPDHLISSFMKLGTRLGDEAKKGNWHHFNIAQRIDFIRKTREDPRLILRHKKKLRHSLHIFLIGLILFTLVSFNPVASKVDDVLVTGIVEKLIKKDPGNARYHSYLAMLYYEQEKWVQSRDSYEISIRLDPRQADPLNNLAWLYLKCPDKRLLNEKKALDLALGANELKRTPYILDTLAEAYLANSMFKEAFLTAGKALELATDNHRYYKKQFQKMKKAFEKYGGSISI